MRRKYDFVFSIGDDCGCAGLLNYLKIREQSCPFDWIKGPDLSVRVDMLLSGFPDLISADYLELMPEEEGNYKKHSTIGYKNIKYNITFLHDFFRNLDHEENIRVAALKYERRIKRLYSKIRSAQKVLVVFMAREKYETEVLKKLALKLNNAYENMDLLVLENCPEFEHDQSELEEFPHLFICKLNNHAVDTSNELKELLGNIPVSGDAICRLVFGCSYAEYEKILNKRTFNYKRFLVKLLCCFIPSKKMRKAVRDKFMFYDVI